MEDNLFSIDTKSDYGNSTLFRFYSLINGCKGTWVLMEDEAIEQGDCHVAFWKSFQKNGRKERKRR